MLARRQITLPAPDARTRLFYAAWPALFWACLATAPAQPPTSATQQSIRLAAPSGSAAAPAAEPQAGLDPPLSIYDSCQMLLGSLKLLPEGQAAAPTTATLRQVDRMLYTVMLY